MTRPVLISLFALGLLLSACTQPTISAQVPRTATQPAPATTPGTSANQPAEVPKTGPTPTLAASPPPASASPAPASVARAASPTAGAAAVASPQTAATSPSPAGPAAASPVVRSPSPATGDPDRDPNELGMIPVLLYHHIGEPEERWQRTPENLRKDLEMLYEKGYRPVHIKDLVNRTIDLPAGRSPVVLTFDDSSASQFKVLGVENGKPIIDPKSAMGVMEQFDKDYPDFGMTASFFIPPLADPPNRLFNQPEYNDIKMEYLVEHGYEIGNHTFFHQRLDAIESPWVERQIALGKSIIESYLPGYDVNVLALPLGMWPEPRHLAIEGSWGDENNPTVHYKNVAILEAQGPPVASPYDGDWDPYSIPRIQALQPLLDDAFSSLDTDPRLPRYVSDGDPNTVTFPKRFADWLNPAALGGARPVER